MSSVRVESFDASRFHEWNDLVRRNRHAGFFHSSTWMEVLRASYGFQPMGLVFRREHQVVGLIPVVEVLSRFTGRRGVSLPFADECPPLIPDGVAADNLLLSMVDFTRRRGWQYFEVRGSNAGLQPELPSVCFYGHRIELPATPEQLWEQLKGPIRTGVRKAESAGVTVEFSTTLEGLRDFHRLYRLTRQRHGLPPQPFGFFAAIHQRVLQPGEGCLILARVKGRCIAGAVFFRCGSRALFKYGAFDTHYQQLRANNLVLWSALKACIQDGCKIVDLGRTSLGNEGLRRFKQGWASREYPIEYAKYNLGLDRFVREKDMVAGWYNSTFRLAPRWMSLLVGKVFYKHWA